MSRRNPARNQERILKAATEEFARYGLGGARVDRIAARAGANKRMLYYYYGNKEDLFLAVLDARYAHIRRAELGEVLVASPTAGSMVLELSSVFAMLIYGLIAWAVERTVWLIFYRPRGAVVAVTETSTSESHSPR